MLEPATEEFKQKVCQKYSTSLQQVKKDVEVLKEWITQQPHLPQCPSDTLLTSFLISSKNRMERAKEKIDNYYTARTMMPEFFGDRDPEDKRVRLAAEEVKAFKLPKFTPEGHRVHMVVFAGDAKKFDVSAYLKRSLAAEDLRFNMDPFSMGEYVIVDCKHFTTSHLLRLTPTVARDIVYCIQDAIPLIIKGIITINSPAYMELAINIVRPFMKKKLLQKIQIHTEGPEVLEKYFPTKLLPSDYGGEEETSEKINESWNQLLREKRNWLMGEGAVTVDEKKRMGRSRKKRVLQEMQGSFKTLCVD